jgi:hypothetical protein
LASRTTKQASLCFLDDRGRREVAGAETLFLQSYGPQNPPLASLLRFPLRVLAPKVDAIRALRGALKVLGRRFGLKAISVRAVSEKPERPPSLQ